MMSTFKAYFEKEILEYLKQYKYVIIGAVILFFSIADPLMLKALPSIIKSQSNMDLTNLMPKSTSQVFQNYIKDMFQIVNIIIVFTVSGTLGKERSEGKLILPYSKGCNVSGMVLAKFFHHIITTTFFTFVGFTVNYYYVNQLFKVRNVSYNNLMESASLMALYFAINISITFLFSSILKKEFATGIIVLFISYFSMIFSSIKSIYMYLPGYLVTAANSFGTKNITKNLLVDIIIILVCICISIFRMKKIDSI